MPFKGTKRHHGNHHHGNRQNGLAQPGKKIEKVGRERSNGQLDVSATTPSHLSTVTRRLPRRHESLTGSEAAFTDVAQTREEVVTAGDDSEALEELYDSQEDIQLHETSPLPELHHPNKPRRIDVNIAGDPAVHVDRGPLILAVTILKSCPVADTLALLIILLQIPAAVLTIVNLLYVALTLVPPTTSNIPSLPSLSDVYQSSGGTLSLVTIALADVLFFVGWIFLWSPLQDLTIDFAQAMIAISLGGRLTSRRSESRSTWLCIVILTLSHFGRCKCLRLPSSSSRFLSVGSSRSLRFTLWGLNLPYPTVNPQEGWLRASLAVHVLAQVTIQSLRQWLSQPGKIKASNTDIKRPSHSSSPSATHVHKSGSRMMTPKTIDFRTIQSEPQVLDLNSTQPKDSREVFAQKLRCQGIYVRIFQPLWAAIASTKTIIMREYYSRNGEDASSSTRERDATNLGSAPFQSEEGRVWATRITTTEIFLETSFFDPLEKLVPESNSENVLHVDGPAATALPPVHVLVNHILWPSVRIFEIKKDHSENDENKGHWAIEIFRLTPGKCYQCLIFRTENHQTVDYMHLTTKKIPANPANASSPRTALKKAIAATEAKLEEEKAAIKKIRKEHKVQITTLKKEVDASNARYVHSGSNDDRQRQRLLQIGQHIRQAEDAAAQVSSQADAMEQVPEHDLSGSKESKENRDAIRKRHSKARAELNEATRQSDRQIAAMQSEAASLQQKRERVQARQNKLKDQYERMSNAKAQGPNGKNTMTVGATHSTTTDEQRQTTEQHFISQSQHLHENLKEIQLGSQQLWQQVRAIESAWDQQQQLRANSAPTTPEGTLPGTSSMMGNRSRPTSRFGNFVFPPPGLPPPQPTVPSSTASSRTTPGHHREGRARSSSMLSNVSGVTDLADYPAAVTAAEMMHNGGILSYASNSRENTRNDVGGYGGGGGRSRSGSHRDQPSPFPPKQNSASPFAQIKGPSPVWR
ncbi:MAG: hypothetical protein M1816_008122 [Peltula sp. TS41687]|nr:MAG: hypothetical protein M1816_008122 [Peltula sp. TS41687]